MDDVRKMKFKNLDRKTPWLVLWGGVGSGKTCMGLHYSINNHWKYVNLISMFDLFKNKLHELNSPTAYFERYKTADFMVLDEIGYEGEAVSHYGSKFDLVDITKDILYFRHMSELNTILITNLNPEKLKEKYGDRIYSRIKELSTFYKLVGDRRNGEKATITKQEK